MSSIARNGGGTCERTGDRVRQLGRNVLGQLRRGGFEAGSERAVSTAFPDSAHLALL